MPEMAKEKIDLIVVGYSPAGHRFNQWANFFYQFTARIASRLR